MAKIKYSKTEEKELIVPNCFCGAEPRVEAEWIAKPVMIRSIFARNYYCSNCHHEPIECGKYCPECGARMI